MEIVERDSFVVRSTESHVIQSIDVDRRQRFSHICVLSASIPKTFYALPEDATISVDEDGSISVVTVSTGSYETNSLRFALVSAMNASPSWTYNPSFPNQKTEDMTGHFTFSVTEMVECSQRLR